MRRLALLAAVVLTAALLAGCGGSDDGEIGNIGTGKQSPGASERDKDGGRDGQGGGAAGGEGGGDSEQGGSSDGGSGGSGGGSDESADAPASASRAETIRRGDEICGRAHKELARLSGELRMIIEDLRDERISEDEYYRRSIANIRKTAAVVQRARLEFAALRVPSSGLRLIRRYAGALEGQVSALAGQEAALRRRSPRAVAHLNSVRTRVARDGHRFAVRFGFKTCGGGI